MLKPIHSFMNQTSGTRVSVLGFGMIVLGFVIYLIGEVMKTSFQFRYNYVTMQVGMVIAGFGLVLGLIGELIMNYKPPKKRSEK